MCGQVFDTLSDMAICKLEYTVLQETISADFPQINHAFDGRAYQWAYLVEHPFAADNAILKINVDDPSGSRNIRYKTEPTLVLHEPWFVPRPNAQREDDGVLVVRALDLSENKGERQGRTTHEFRIPVRVLGFLFLKYRFTPQQKNLNVSNFG